MKCLACPVLDAIIFVYLLTNKQHRVRIIRNIHIYAHICKSYSFNAAFLYVFFKLSNSFSWSDRDILLYKDIIYSLISNYSTLFIVTTW